MLSALLFAACTSDDSTDTVVEPSSLSTPIMLKASSTPFEVWNGSRSTAITSSNLSNYDFDVWAFSDGNALMGSSEKGVRFTHTTTSSGTSASDGGTGYWDYASRETVGYWPNPSISYNGNTTTYPTVDFFAVYPAPGTYGSGGETEELEYNSTSITATSKKITLDISTTSTKQFDFMYAIETGKKKGDGAVTMNFHHALSQIVFTARLGDGVKAATVHQVTIHNVYKRGECDFSKGSLVWTVNTTISSPTTNYMAPQPSYSVDVTSSTTPVEITESKGPLFLIPQTLSATSSFTSGTTSDPTKDSEGNTVTVSGCYLDVECKVQKASDNYIVGAASGDNEWGHVYLPFSATWKPGNKYVYNLVFEPKSSAKPRIQISETVSPWL